VIGKLLTARTWAIASTAGVLILAGWIIHSAAGRDVPSAGVRVGPTETG
jgi:hypothetical protein